MGEQIDRQKLAHTNLVRVADAAGELERFLYKVTDHPCGFVEIKCSDDVTAEAVRERLQNLRDALRDMENNLAFASREMDCEP